MSPLNVVDPLILLAVTVNLYCRFSTSLSLVNVTSVCVHVEEIFRSISRSVMISPVILSVRVTSALHTGELCQQNVYTHNSLLIINSPMIAIETHQDVLHLISMTQVYAVCRDQPSYPVEASLHANKATIRSHYVEMTRIPPPPITFAAISHAKTNMFAPNFAQVIFWPFATYSY